MPMLRRKKTSAAKTTINRQALKPQESPRQTPVSSSRLEAPDKSSNNAMTRKFRVVYRKKTSKKHKTWEADGILELRSGIAVLRNEEMKVITTCSQSWSELDGLLELNSMEVEVDSEILDENSNFKPKLLSPSKKGCNTSKLINKPFKRMNPNHAKLTNLTIKTRPTINEPINETTKTKAAPVASAPLDSASLIFPSVSEGDNTVTLSPTLANRLRPHQKVGLLFLYSCVMGLSSPYHNGCILADEMGLGKTLMTIALIYTLLRQGPSGEPVCKKVLIVTPVTLISNWRKEFTKWLGNHRVGVLAIGDGLKANELLALKTLSNSKVYEVVLIGYEKVVLLADLLRQVQFDMLVCDEGHRLKSGSTKAARVLKDFGIPKKVLLSGTPIQNDLDEFYTLVDFVCPGLLGTASEFQKRFTRPISRSREKGCRDKTILDLGKQKSAELVRLTKPIMLRRSRDVLKSVLPSQTDVVIFVKPGQGQLAIMRLLEKAIASEKHDTLSLINTFRKACNAPTLLANDALFSRIFDGNPPKTYVTSAKMDVLDQLITTIHESTDEKVVIASNYTKTLDSIESLFTSKRLTCCRLDGNTPPKTRDSLVTNFNKSSKEKCFAFLLSSKAGGVGLNLVGASRLILVDGDWNPAIDIQTMARIHRDGQKRKTVVYRLVTCGTLDEKIFQRQLMKRSLSDKFLDGRENAKDDIFNHADMKELFKVDENTLCNTHDLSGCSCGGSGTKISVESTDIEDSVEGWMSAKTFQLTQDSKRPDICNLLAEFRHIEARQLARGLLESGDGVVDYIARDRKVSYIFMSKGNDEDDSSTTESFDGAFEKPCLLKRRKTGNLTSIGKHSDLSKAFVSDSGDSSAEEKD